MGGPSWIIGRNLPQSDQDVSAYLRKQRVRRKSLRDELLAQMSGYDFGFGISKHEHNSRRKFQWKKRRRLKVCTTPIWT